MDAQLDETRPSSELPLCAYFHHGTDLIVLQFSLCLSVPKRKHEIHEVKRRLANPHSGA